MSLDEVQLSAQRQFDRQSLNYGRTHLLAQTDDLKAAFEHVPHVRDGRALDVATGGGHTALFLARRGYLVTACDISGNMLERARVLAGESGLRIATAQHAAEEFPYASKSFDVVTCRVAAHHFSNPAAFVFEAARVLKPGGVLVLIDGTVSDDFPEAAEWLQRVELLRDPSHQRFLSAAQWRMAIIAAGLEILSSEVAPLKQPDLENYFDTAGTMEENRVAVRELVRTASDEVRSVFRLSEENGKTVWWWSRLTLTARKL